MAFKCCHGEERQRRGHLYGPGLLREVYALSGTRNDNYTVMARSAATKQSFSTQQCRHLAKKQSGLLMIPVAVAIAIIGILAYFSANQSAINVNSANREIESSQLEYVAQAGLQHGLREAAHQGCGPYTDLTNVGLDNDKYTTSLTTDLGSTTAYTVQTDQDTWIRSDLPDNNMGTDWKLPIRYEGGTIERPMYKYDISAIPANASVLSATAWFYVNKNHAEGPVNIHTLTSDWQDSSATWTNMGDQMHSSIIATIPTQPNDSTWVSVNLTNQVQSWVNGQTNFGITLNSLSEGTHGEYVGEEDVTYKSYIDVVVGTSPTPSATLKSVGTLANGVKRTIVRNNLVLHQNPFSLIHQQPDAASGEDAEIWQQAPDNNYGNSAETWVSSATNDTTRSLLRFNMGTVPKGATIIEASLSLERQSGSGASQPVSAHRITNEWDEDSVTWNRRKTGINWSSSGAEFDSSAITTTAVGPVNQRYDWDITSLVQGWVDESYPNYGVILVAGMPGMAGERFYTSDETDSTRWPSLSITYTCGCGTACLSPQGSGGRIVMIGDWPGPNPDARDLEKEAIIESWGYEVDQWDDNFIWLIDFNNYDLVYISETASSTAVVGQLSWRPIPIVNEQGNLNSDLGFSSDKNTTTGDSIDIVDNSHFISQPFALGGLSIYSAPMEILTAGGTRATELTSLGEVAGSESLMLLDVGAAGVNGTVADRRVALPLGRATNSSFNWKYLNNNGRLLVQRSLEWAMGGGTISQGDLLLVVNNDGSLTTQEQAKKTLFESWNWTVNIIDSGDNQTAFDTATVANDVVYITEDINSGDLNTKLVSATIGVVTEEDNLSDEFGFNDSNITWGSGTDLKIFTGHYITNTLPEGAGTILSTSESLGALNANLAPDIQSIGYSVDGLALAALDTGAALAAGGTAAGRRVYLPWGGDNMDINHLNADGLTILERSLEWANGANIDFSPLAHWRLDENNGTTAVDSAGGHDGTLTNGPVWAAGMVEGGLSYDGIDDAIVVPHADTLSLTDAMSFSAWVRSDAFGQDGPYDLVVSKGTVATSYAYYFGTLNDEIIFGFSAAGSYREFVTPSLNLATDTWHHIAATYSNADNRVRLYHNGVEVLSTTTTYEPSATTHDLYIGSSEDGADWDGILDDVRMYDRVLAADEIAILAERPGPIAHWKFDEGSGNTAIDSEGGHDATISDPVWDPGQDGGAIRVTSLNQAGAAPHDDNLTLTKGLTVMAWVSKANLLGYDAAIDKASLGSDINYFLGTWEDEIVFGFSTSSDDWQGYYTNGVNLSTGSWDHIAASFDNAADEVRIYRNGGLVQTFPTTLEPVTNTGNLWLGRSALNNEILSGRLDDARIYNRVLDGNEIEAVYDGAASGGGSGYTELNQTWNATASDTWQTVDLSGMGVPANAIVEVSIENGHTSGEHEAGVRAVGSSLDRFYFLHEAEGGGVDAVTLHVQTNASSQIQHYADNAGFVTFRLLGYWSSGRYVEQDVLFTAGQDNSWTTHSLSSYGVSSGQVVEIIALNNSSGTEYQGGVRASGSSLTQTFDLHEAEAGESDFLSIMVQASNDASASIEVFAEKNGEIEFKLAGVWDTAPGTYTESRAVLGNPTTDGAWQTIDLSSFGVPPNSVAQIIMANRSTGTQNRQGVRSVGSGLERVIDIHEAESGGEDLVSLHVPVDDNSQIQWKHQDVSDAHRFYLAGWWVLP